MMVSASIASLAAGERVVWRLPLTFCVGAAVFEKSSTHELDIDFLDCSKKLGKPSLKILGLKKSKASRHRKF